MSNPVYALVNAYSLINSLRAHSRSRDGCEGLSKVAWKLEWPKLSLLSIAFGRVASLRRPGCPYRMPISGMRDLRSERCLRVDAPRSRSATVPGVLYRTVRRLHFPIR